MKYMERDMHWSVYPRTDSFALDRLAFLSQYWANVSDVGQLFKERCPNLQTLIQVATVDISRMFSPRKNASPTFSQHWANVSCLAGWRLWENWPMRGAVAVLFLLDIDVSYIGVWQLRGPSSCCRVVWNHEFRVQWCARVIRDRLIEWIPAAVISRFEFISSQLFQCSISDWC